MGGFGCCTIEPLVANLIERALSYLGGLLWPALLVHPLLRAVCSRQSRPLRWQRPSTFFDLHARRCRWRNSNIASTTCKTLPCLKLHTTPQGPVPDTSTLQTRRDAYLLVRMYIRNVLVLLAGDGSLAGTASSCCFLGKGVESRTRPPLTRDRALWLGGGPVHDELACLPNLRWQKRYRYAYLHPYLQQHPAAVLSLRELGWLQTKLASPRLGNLASHNKKRAGM